MLRLRWISASVLIPVSIVFIYIGGVWYILYVLGLLSLVASEYAGLMHVGGLRPSRPIVLGAVVVFVLGAFLTAPAGREAVAPLARLTLTWPEWALGTALVLCLGAMAWHVFDYERGADGASVNSPGSDWALTVAGGLYLGLCASYFVQLREGLGDDGRWWILVVLSGQWVSDAAAMLVGRRFGRHKLSPRASPGKTWEGYFGGVLGAALMSALVAILAVWLSGGAVHFTWPAGLAVGALCGAVTPLGDLGESLFKRQVHVKDSGTAVPGHGGMLDRTDSQLWAVLIGYYFYVLVILR
jgi:phosphatidate cytidylyltransferase